MWTQWSCSFTVLGSASWPSFLRATTYICLSSSVFKLSPLHCLQFQDEIHALYSMITQGTAVGILLQQQVIVTPLFKSAQVTRKLVFWSTCPSAAAAVHFHTSIKHTFYLTQVFDSLRTFIPVWRLLALSKLLDRVYKWECKCLNSQLPQ